MGGSRFNFSFLTTTLVTLLLSFSAYSANNERSKEVDTFGSLQTLLEKKEQKEKQTSPLCKNLAMHVQDLKELRQMRENFEAQNPNFLSHLFMCSQFSITNYCPKSQPSCLRPTITHLSEKHIAPKPCYELLFQNIKYGEEYFHLLDKVVQEIVDTLSRKISKGSKNSLYLPAYSALLDFLNTQLYEDNAGIIQTLLAPSEDIEITSEAVGFLMGIRMDRDHKGKVSSVYKVPFQTMNHQSLTQALKSAQQEACL